MDTLHLVKIMDSKTDPLMVREGQLRAVYANETGGKWRCLDSTITPDSGPETMLFHSSPTVRIGKPYSDSYVRHLCSTEEEFDACMRSLGLEVAERVREEQER